MADSDPGVLLDLPAALVALKLKDRDGERDELIEKSFLPGILNVVEEEVGWVEPRTVTIEVESRAGAAVLPRTTIRALTAVADHAGQVVSAQGARVSSSTGIIYGLPDGLLLLTLEVGHLVIPESIRRGAAEVLIEAWETQRSTGEPRPFLLPYRAQAWLKPFSMGPSLR